MPKMRNKKAALRIIYETGDEILKMLEAKGITQSVVGRGELSQLNKGERRRKDLFTMALCRFVAGNVVRTPYWEMVIQEPDKPVVFFKILKKK